MINIFAHNVTFVSARARLVQPLVVLARRRRVYRRPRCLKAADFASSAQNIDQRWKERERRKNLSSSCGRRRDRANTQKTPTFAPKNGDSRHFAAAAVDRRDDEEKNYAASVLLYSH